jgi:hypothetical protein
MKNSKVEDCGAAVVVKDADASANTSAAWQLWGVDVV